MRGVVALAALLCLASMAAAGGPYPADAYGGAAGGGAAAPEVFPFPEHQVLYTVVDDSFGDGLDPSWRVVQCMCPGPEVVRDAERGAIRMVSAADGGVGALVSDLKLPDGAWRATFVYQVEGGRGPGADGIAFLPFHDMSLYTPEALAGAGGGKLGVLGDGYAVAVDTWGNTEYGEEAGMEMLRVFRGQPGADGYVALGGHGSTEGVLEDGLRHEVELLFDGKTLWERVDFGGGRHELSYHGIPDGRGFGFSASTGTHTDSVWLYGFTLEAVEVTAPPAAPCAVPLGMDGMPEPYPCPPEPIVVDDTCMFVPDACRIEPQPFDACMAAAYGMDGGMSFGWPCDVPPPCLGFHVEQVDVRIRDDGSDGFAYSCASPCMAPPMPAFPSAWPEPAPYAVDDVDQDGVPDWSHEREVRHAVAVEEPTLWLPDDAMAEPGYRAEVFVMDCMPVSEPCVLPPYPPPEPMPFTVHAMDGGAAWPVAVTAVPTPVAVYPEGWMTPTPTMVVHPANVTPIPVHPFPVTEPCASCIDCREPMRAWDEGWHDEWEEGWDEPLIAPVPSRELELPDPTGKACDCVAVGGADPIEVPLADGQVAELAIESIGQRPVDIVLPDVATVTYVPTWGLKGKLSVDVADDPAALADPLPALPEGLDAVTVLHIEPEFQEGGVQQAVLQFPYDAGDLGGDEGSLAILYFDGESWVDLGAFEAATVEGKAGVADLPVYDIDLDTDADLATAVVGHTSAYALAVRASEPDEGLSELTWALMGLAAIVLAALAVWSVNAAIVVRQRRDAGIEARMAAPADDEPAETPWQVLS